MWPVTMSKRQRRLRQGASTPLVPAATARASPPAEVAEPARARRSGNAGAAVERASSLGGHR